MVRHMILAVLAVGLLALNANAALAAQPTVDVRAGYVRLERVLEATDLGVRSPSSISWDDTMNAFVLVDAATEEVRAFDILGRARMPRHERPDVRRDPLLARDPASGNTFRFEGRTGTLIELDGRGTRVSTRHLDEFGIAGVQGIAFAPSGDSTDDSESTSLYVSAAGTVDSGETVGAGVFELALIEPASSSALSGVAEVTASRVQTINTSGTAWNPDSPDPSGLAYIGGSTDSLVVVDGEVEEQTGAGWNNANLWLATRQGNSTSFFDTTTADPSNKEPVGAAYDPAGNRLYVGKDGGSSRVWVYEVTAGGGFTQVDTFTLFDHGIDDAEGLAFGDGVLYVADGLGKEVWAIDPVTRNVLRHFDTQSLGMSDPEGIGFNSVSKTLWIASRDENEGLLEVTTAGTPLTHAHYEGVSPLSPGGLEIAPATSGSGTNIWVADRGVDNGTNPSENDGRIYELTLGEPAPPPDPTSNLILNGSFEQASGGQPTAWTTDPRFTQSNAVVHAGSFSGRHQSATDVGYKVTQDVPVLASQTYTFDGWLNAPAASSDAFKVIVKIQWRNSSGRVGNAIKLGQIAGQTTGWTSVSSTSLLAPADATTARVMMVVSSLATTVYVDDFSLTHN